jgi:uncharacterized integral membrane protein
METSVKAGRAALLSVVMLVVLAGPAQAATPVVLAAAKPWHYWISFVLAASFLGLLFMMLVGYVVKVVMLKYGIRVGRKST